MNIIMNGSSGVLAEAFIETVVYEPQIQLNLISSKSKLLEEKYLNHLNIKTYSNINEVGSCNGEAIFINFGFPRTSNGEVLATTYNDTIETLRAVNEKKITKFINISSQSVYNQSGEKIPTEETAVCPTNLYGMTKYGIEKLIEVYTSDKSIEYTHIRLGSLIGIKYDKRLINNFFRLIKQNKNITVDEGNNKVSFLEISDAAEALKTLILNANNTKNKILNLSNDSYLSVYEIAKESVEIANQMGYTGTDIVMSGNISDHNNFVDSNKFYREFDWYPKYNMHKIIELLSRQLLKGNV